MLDPNQSHKENIFGCFYLAHNISRIHRFSSFIVNCLCIKGSGDHGHQRQEEACESTAHDTGNGVLLYEAL